MFSVNLTSFSFLVNRYVNPINRLAAETDQDESVHTIFHKGESRITGWESLTMPLKIWCKERIWTPSLMPFSCAKKWTPLHLSALLHDIEVEQTQKPLACHQLSQLLAIVIKSIESCEIEEEKEIERKREPGKRQCMGRDKTQWFNCPLAKFIIYM